MAEVFYKFLSVENAFRVMEEHQLKVSLIRELNDIYDCEPIFGPAADKPGYINSSSAKEFLSRTADMYGLLCFSKGFRSPLLWGHYAEQAKGIALGFNPASFLQQDIKMDVEYRESRPVVTWLEDASKGVPDFLQNMREHFGVKALEWKYELTFRTSALDYPRISFGAKLRGAVRYRCSSARWLDAVTERQLP